ncbi:MAG: hypothetical protein NZ733_04655 [Aigarchaeota archaeon]|nr:hypothetical protein [Aigarchaeota archaeon]MCS7126986.1 hypothetical protein [Candidatus Calditenuaceae archaeon]MDW8043108.1 hypothetical protein [Nitrososphaerota archaeon]
MAVLGRVVCPHCGKLTIKGKFCMNCGKELEAPATQPPVQPRPTPPQPGAPTPPTIELAAPPAEQQAPPEAPKEVQPEELTEERRLVEQLSKLYNWQLRLVDLFLDGEATFDAFSEIYTDYESRIATLNQKRLEMISRYEERIKELTQRLDNLKLRHEVSEITDREYIRQKIEIDREISKLRPKLTILQNPIEIKIGDIPRFRSDIQERMERVKRQAKDLNMPEEWVQRVVNNLRVLLDAIGELVKQYERIKAEMVKLELRYKVGELKHDDYMSQRQRLERQLELTF